MRRGGAADVLLGSGLMRHDAIVIGSDETACAAALEGSKHGLDVLLIDGGRLRPCDFVRRRSLPMHHLREAVVRSADFHQVFDNCSRAPRLRDVQLSTLMKQMQEVGEAQSRELRRRLSSSGVQANPGPASFLSGNRVLMGSGDVREAPIIIIACESRPRHPRRFPFDEYVVCDPWSIVQFEHVPRSLLIVGAEMIGCELACLFASLGTTVTLLDRRSQMLRYVDRDIIEILHRKMQALGIDVVLHETLEALDIDKSTAEPHAVVQLGNGRVERCERVLIIAGERADVEGLNLDLAGVAKDPSGFIITDGHYLTCQPGVYAVGGAISDTSLVRAGPQQGRAAMRNALGVEDEMASDWPTTIYSIPEISMVGLTQEVCERLEIPHAVGVARYEDLLCSQIRCDRDGLLKLVADRKNRRLLGVHLIGSCARELIQVGASVLRQEEAVDVLANGIFSNPSLSEAYGKAALDCLDQLDTAARH